MFFNFGWCNENSEIIRIKNKMRIIFLCELSDHADFRSHNSSEKNIANVWWEKCKEIQETEKNCIFEFPRKKNQIEKNLRVFRIECDNTCEYIVTYDSTFFPSLFANKSAHLVAVML